MKEIPYYSCINVNNIYLSQQILQMFHQMNLDSHAFDLKMCVPFINSSIHLIVSDDFISNETNLALKTNFT